MNKIKLLFINTGRIIAIFLMLAPLYIILNNDKYSQKEFWFYLIVWILYDIYMYDVITKKNK